ncbi:MAG TPA: hypothetical protein VFX49_20120 [Chloroflexota bacterium]|nr:hypothetical protein [Chloroflexota bacterium]
MADSRPDPRDIRSFDDLTQLPDDILRQVAMRVHVIDLAYAFGKHDALRDRLLGAVRPELASEIRSAIRASDWASERTSPDDQTRTARARVIDAVKTELGL